jgi:FG-GAP repeat
VLAARIIVVATIGCLGSALTPASSANAASAAPSHTSTLTPPAGVDNSEFGDAVAVSGNTVAVAAPDELINGTEQGAVFVYTRPTAGWKSLSAAAELRFPASPDNELNSVAISGNTIAIGDVGTPSGEQSGQGAVYVYVKPAHGWKSTSHPTAVLTASDGATDDGLGATVAISGDTIVSGAAGHATDSDADRGAAYVFAKPTSGWTTATQTAELTGTTGATDDLFGASVAVSGDTIAIGAPGHEDGTAQAAGLGYVFLKPTNGPWVDATQNRKLEASDPVTDAGLGAHQAVAIDGDTIVFGADTGGDGFANGIGSAYVFERPDTGWTSTQTLIDTAELTPSDGVNGEEFGSTVAIAGGTIVVGAPLRSFTATDSDNGAAYVFDKTGADWTSGTQTSELHDPATPAAHSEYGTTVATAGATVLVGAIYENSGQGAVFLTAPAAPSLSKPALSHPTWVLGTKAAALNPKHKPKGGVEISFRLIESASVSLSFSEQVHGHLVHKGTLTVAAKAGKNTVFIDGPLGHGKRLAAGHGTVTITAKNANGTSTAKPLHFTVRKPSKKH